MTRSHSSLDRLRLTASKALLVFIWLHVPFFLLLAALLGQSGLVSGGLSIAFATAATASWIVSRDSLQSRLMTGVALVAMVSLLVQLLSGHAWQLDAHMYFFAALALLTTF
ncbi:MAG TPA: hypothetical protein VHO91_20655, partial [Rhodopila sp.]|nr:hypothetical protein [Rhodopila sp.]